jgi:putative transposase
VCYELSGRTVMLVVDPHQQDVLRVEDDKGLPLGAATPLDLIANTQRQRCRSHPQEELAETRTFPTTSAVEQAYQQQQQRLSGSPTNEASQGVC